MGGRETVPLHFYEKLYPWGIWGESSVPRALVFLYIRMISNRKILLLPIGRLEYALGAFVLSEEADGILQVGWLADV